MIPIPPLGDVEFQPDYGVRTNGDLLGELTRFHPWVNGGTTDAASIQDFRDAEEAWCCGLSRHQFCSSFWER